MENLASIVVSENHGGPVTCVGYANGVSDRFATASVDGTVRVWDTADYGVLTTAVVRDAGEARCLILTQVRAGEGVLVFIQVCGGGGEGEAGVLVCLLPALIVLTADHVPLSRWSTVLTHNRDTLPDSYYDSPPQNH